MDMTTLIAASVTAAGAAPTGNEYGVWRGRVLNIASDLAAMVAGYEKREDRKNGIGLADGDRVTVFHAKLVRVETVVKGQGDNQVTKGVLFLEAFSSSNPDQDGLERIETAPFGTAEGDEEYVRAQALVGQNVKIYKRNFLHPGDKSKKLKELVAVDPASGVATPAPAPLPQSNARRLEQVKGLIGARSLDEKAKFRVWLEEQEMPDTSMAWTDVHLDAIDQWLLEAL